SATEDELKKYYEDHKEHFNSPEAAKASHILVEEEETANEARKEINDGMAFEDAAKKYATCPSKEKGGDLGEFTKGSKVPEFEKAVFSMEPDQISDPVKSQFGYHIIKVDYTKEASTSDFEDVKDQVNEQVMGLKQQERYLNK